MLVDQVLVRHYVGELRIGQIFRPTEDHVGLHALELVGHGLHQRDERRVEEEDPVPCMVHDVDELRGMEPWVQRVTDGAHARDTEVDLEMSMRIPRYGAQAIAVSDAPSLEGAGESLAARPHLAPTRAVYGTFDGSAHDLLMPVHEARVLDE